ncbi:1-deoxyxylulose-5-phosphate synthase YajO [Paraconexibacter sp. AEG42_29]|uniref:1-deoxyxylulose-5-phosphate synthase YajO n=1 Tax=Paraconexibacter sp. AEG42_29 TaxID=2997339 RepID=A0AAU7AR41_9ACTN
MSAPASSALDVHPLCLGGNVFGWTADDAASFAVLDRYTGAGGNFVDTADVYSAWVPGHEGGESEAVIGRWLAQRGGADGVQIATKVGMNAASGFHNLKPETVTAACDASLERLGVERIDLYYAHRDDTDVPLEESLGAFDALVKAGKVAHIGVSNVPPDRLREMVAVTKAEGYAPIAALQPAYNLLDRAGFEDELQAICAENDIACVPYYGLAMGFLTGKYTQESVAADIDSPRAKGAIKTYAGNERTWVTLDALRVIAAERSVPVAAVALAWLHGRDTVLAPIASARTVEQLDDLLPFVGLELTADEVAALDAASAA